MFKNRKREKELDIMEKISVVIATALKTGISEKDLDYAYNIGKEAYKECEKDFTKSKNPKISTIQINAKDKEDAIRQVKQLELDKEIEKDIIKILKNN